MQTILACIYYRMDRPDAYWGWHYFESRVTGVYSCSRGFNCDLNLENKLSTVQKWWLVRTHEPDQLETKFQQLLQICAKYAPHHPINWYPGTGEPPDTNVPATLPTGIGWWRRYAQDSLPCHWINECASEPWSSGVTHWNLVQRSCTRFYPGFYPGLIGTLARLQSALCQSKFCIGHFLCWANERIMSWKELNSAWQYLFGFLVWQQEPWAALTSTSIAINRAINWSTIITVHTLIHGVTIYVFKIIIYTFPYMTS